MKEIRNMLKASCIRHPNRDHLVFIIRAWQISFCSGNKCAAALLSFLEYWHNLQLCLQATEACHEPNAHTQPLYQEYSQIELSNGILGLYEGTEIKSALKLLEEKGAITIYDRPMPRSKVEEAIQLCFMPNRINEWLQDTYE